MGNTLEHEFLIYLFRNNTDLAAILLRRYLGVAIPDYAVAIAASEDATEVVPDPQVRKCDFVVIYLHERADRPPVWAVIVEVQRGMDKDKPWVWPLYHARIRHWHRCPTTLLVITPSEALARAFRTPIDTGQPESAWRPLVTTPRELMIGLSDAGVVPEMLILATLAHISEPDFETVSEALLTALGAIDAQRAREYADGVLDMLTGPAKEIWRKKMATSVYRYQSDFAKGYYADGEAAGEAVGEARGEARAVLLLLKSRQLQVSDEVRQRIESCTDRDQLDEWVQRSATVADVSQLFA